MKNKASLRKWHSLKSLTRYSDGKSYGKLGLDAGTEKCFYIKTKEI